MEEAILRICAQDGFRQIPDAIKNAPELAAGLDFYLQAFWDLHTCRPTGWSEGQIPWTSLVEWGRMYCENQEQFEVLEFHVKNLDAAYLKWRQAQNKD